MNRKVLALCVPGLGALALAAAILAPARQADASPGMHIAASICRSKNYLHVGEFTYTSGAVIRNEGTSGQSINCAVPVDFSVGSLEFRFVGVDNSAVDSVSCAAISVDTANNVVWATASVPSFPAAATMGAFNTTTGVGPASSGTQRHHVNCGVPGKNGTKYSALYGIRLF